MTHLAARKPSQLSGGQQQRVAVARALVNRPEVLLLDEPLGALDLKLRRQMQVELKRIQTEVGLTFIHVTHDQEEAMTMADTVAVMNLGRIEQLGHPEVLYDLPKTSFVANFLGQSNLGNGVVTGTEGTNLVVEVAGTTVRIPKARSSVHEGPITFGVRPEKVRITETQPVGGGNDVKATVVDVSFSGVATQFLVTTPSGATWAVYEQNLDIERNHLRPGDAVWLEWNSGHAFGVPVDDAAAAAGADAASPTASRGRVVTAGVAHVAGAGTGVAGPDPAAGRKRSRTAYLLLLPGGLWLLVFFVLPLVQLFTVSLQSGFPGFPGYYYRDVNGGNYLTALTDFAGHFGRSLCMPDWPPCLPSSSRTRSPTRWRSRPAAGAT